jgi:ParB family transcriptional regulator, chromosome partitioning protein
MPRVFRPGQTRASSLRNGSELEARRQIDQARYGPQLVLEVDQIEPNPRNPRRSFSDEALKQLAESMKRDGQIQPVVVRRVGSTWQLIAGERRWRAARLAGLPSVAAVQREATDEVAFRLALVENIHREDLSHQEKVEALDMLGEMVQGRGLRRTALELNMSAGWLSRRLSMRRDPVVFPALEEGRITFAQAHELLSAPAVARRTLLDKVLRLRGSVPSAEVRNWVRAVRQENRDSQQRIVAKIVDNGSAETVDSPVEGTGEAESASSPSFVDLLKMARSLGAPRTAEDIAAVRELAAHFSALCSEVPNPSGLASVRRSRNGRDQPPPFVDDVTGTGGQRRH